MKQFTGFEFIKKSFRTKQVRYGGYAALITIAAAAGLLIINLIIKQYTVQLDMTDNSRYSLSDQSYNVIDQITAPVTVYGLWQSGQTNAHISNITEVLDLYTGRNKNINFELIDPDRNPLRLRKYDRDQKGLGWGTVIVEGSKGFRVIRPEEMYDIDYNQNITGIAIERRLTSALLFTGTGEIPVLYEITNHREMPLANLGLSEFIQQENYILNQLNLIQSDIPEDTSVLLMVSPVSDLSRPEAEKILNYLDSGGRLFLMADYRLQEMKILNEVLSSYGINYDYGIVLETDPKKVFNNSSDMIRPEITEHAVTTPIRQIDGTIITPQAMGIKEILPKRDSVRLTPLLMSSPGSILRTDINNQSPGKTDSDISGPIAVAMAVTDPVNIPDDKKQTRIILLGSLPFVSTFFGNVSIFNKEFIPGNNIDFLMNSLTWLNNNPDTITIRSKNTNSAPMDIKDARQAVFIIVFIVIIIPLIFFILGLVTWLRRRHL